MPFFIIHNGLRVVAFSLPLTHHQIFLMGKSLVNEQAKVAVECPLCRGRSGYGGMWTCVILLQDDIFKASTSLDHGSKLRGPSLKALV
ncbi:hypothetical protein TNCV_2055711 [Trichonephila clavipes]|nr:hypothetical protein TNCV_2055711 [Trichonephila clavipes]